MTDADLLNRLTTVSWSCASELARSVAAFRRQVVAVADVEDRLRALERFGAVAHRPRQEADGSYRLVEYRLTEAGAKMRLPGNLWSPHA